MNDETNIRALTNGVNQKGVRDHNERLILTLLQRHGDLPGSEIARRTRLSAQTVSVILRKLEGDGLVRKGEPVRGKVGKPFVPIALDPNGAFAFGIKVGRRSSEVFLTDLRGNILFKSHLNYTIALPDQVFAFIQKALRDAQATLSDADVGRICGIGIAAPFEIWKWSDYAGPVPAEFLSWRDLSMADEVARLTNLPVFVMNDATSACWAEHVYGRGREFSDYVYFFVSTFVGGGVVLDQTVYEGGRGNAGALGPLRVGDRNGQTKQLLDVASIRVLEQTLADSGHDPKALWAVPQDWSAFDGYVEDWLDNTANAIAQACISACAVIDFEAVIIDGYVPQDVRATLVEKVRKRLPQEDSRGLILPEVFEGGIGGEARALGAACSPFFAQFFLGKKPTV